MVAAAPRFVVFGGACSIISLAVIFARSDETLRTGRALYGSPEEFAACKAQCDWVTWNYFTGKLYVQPQGGNKCRCYFKLHGGASCHFSFNTDLGGVNVASKHYTYDAGEMGGDVPRVKFYWGSWNWTGVHNFDHATVLERFDNLDAHVRAWNQYVTYHPRTPYGQCRHVHGSGCV